MKAEAAAVQPQVAATVQQEAPAAVAIVETVKAEIAAEPSPVIAAIETPAPVVAAVETVDAVVETPVVAAVRNEPVQIDLVDAVNEAAADVDVPVEVVAPPPAAPKPAAAPSTGSLFFVADADTPPSVTRSLFEPVVSPVKPADEIAQADKQDDDSTEERSA